MQCEVWSVKREVWSVNSAVRSVKCEARSGASNVTCETGHHFRRMHARTGLAGAQRMQVLLRKVLYIPKATSAPPRAGTTGIYIYTRFHV